MGISSWQLMAKRTCSVSDQLTAHTHTVACPRRESRSGCRAMSLWRCHHRFRWRIKAKQARKMWQWHSKTGKKNAFSMVLLCHWLLSFWLRFTAMIIHAFQFCPKSSIDLSMVPFEAVNSPQCTELPPSATTSAWSRFDMSPWQAQHIDTALCIKLPARINFPKANCQWMHPSSVNDNKFLIGNSTQVNQSSLDKPSSTEHCPYGFL